VVVLAAALRFAVGLGQCWWLLWGVGLVLAYLSYSAYDVGVVLEVVGSC